MKHLKSLPAMGAIAATSVLGVLMTAGVAKAVPAPAPRLVQGNVATCDGAGLTGQIILQGEDTGASSEAGTGTITGQFLDVTINAGWTASGVAVKGGPNTNVYDGPFVGPVTIEDMRAPNNEGGNQADISHWLVCGSKTGPTNGPTMKPSGPAKTGGGGSQPIDGWIAGGAALLVALPMAGALIWRRRHGNA